MERPVGVAQHLARQEYDVRLAGGDDLFRLGRLEDEADGAAGQACFGADSRRKKPKISAPPEGHA
jgi:hypothetical protein